MLLYDISRSCDVNAAVPLQIPNKQGELLLVTLLQAGFGWVRTHKKNWV